jgi:putative membrane protein
MSIQKDSVRISKEVNARNILIDQQITFFIIEALDARRLMLETGSLAATQGATPGVRAYGEMMMHDQRLMINDLSTIAACKKISLPETMSLSKLKDLENLKQKAGEGFDKKFIKKAIAGQRHDLKEFEKATAFKDRYVRIFARHYITMIQNHLETIEGIKQGDVKTVDEGVVTVVSN